jgi:hypothetical protein
MRKWLAHGQMFRPSARGASWMFVLAAWLALVWMTGCSDDDETCFCPQNSDEPDAPQGLAEIAFGTSSLTLWPYTGAALDGVAADPVNLVLVGHAAPLEVRAALVALDGDRSGSDLPPVAPFTETWSDANGDVMAAYAGDGGWSGSVIQLQLGGYGPLRVHLRLFETEAAWGDSGCWTLASAHFELLIPGTADHQVLSWELAEQTVAVDLARCGLLDPVTPGGTTGMISAAPGFRTIPVAIYNGLPVELRALINGPLEDVTEPVPIETDGAATIAHLSQAATIVPDTASEDLDLLYDQVIPKPFCNEDGYEYVHVGGPISFHKSVIIDSQGGYQYESYYLGELTVTPLDVTTNPPTPIGEPYSAVVNDSQSGLLDAQGWRVGSVVQRIASQSAGAEQLRSEIYLTSAGGKTSRTQTTCL